MDSDADPVLATPRLNVAGIAQPVRARVLSIHRCAAAAQPAQFLHVEIDVGGTALEGAFLPGQSFGVVPPASADAAGGKPTLRIYSIASPSAGEDGSGKVVSATIRVAQGSAGSGAYVASLNAGDELLITGPLGRNFLLPAEPDRHDYVFVGAGTGVAPFRAMLLELATRAPLAQISLISAATNPAELVYDHMFHKHATNHSTFRYVPAVTTDGAELSGPIDQSMHAMSSLIESPRTLIYVCGPGTLDRCVLASLERQGLDSAYFAAHTDAQAIRRPTRRCMIVSY